ncbi:MAG: ATP-binding protein [Candidatus Thorarchaeota archaeon]
MSPTRYRCTPQISRRSSDNIIIGGSSDKPAVFIGQLAESTSNKIWLDASKEHVIIIVGKRGSGKSYTLGSLIEGFCSSVEGVISNGPMKRAVVLFDTLDIFWPTLYPVGESHVNEIQRQVEDLGKWRLSQVPLNVSVYVPAGFRKEIMPSSFLDLYLDHRDMHSEDWAALMGVDLVKEPRGQLLSEVYGVQEQGVGPSIDVMLNRLEAQEILENYNSETVRAVRQRLRAFSHYPIFSEGTALSDFIREGELSVLLLNGLPDDLRSVVVSTLVRKIIRERSEASLASKMDKLRPDMDTKEKKRIADSLERGLPRITIAIDEAQNAVPKDKTTGATEQLVKLVREGRNIGTSLLITTQQPGAIDTKVMAQADIVILHKLVMQRDIDIARRHLKSRIQDTIRTGNTDLQFDDLLRNLDVGQCVITCTDVGFSGNRAVIMNVRPRVSRHGGFED